MPSESPRLFAVLSSVALIVVLSACTTPKAGFETRKPASGVPESEVEEFSVKDRIDGRTFPSIFEAWAPAQNLNFTQAAGKPEAVIPLSQIETSTVTMSRHDLIWKGPTALGLVWNQPYPGLGTGFTPESIAKAQAIRQQIIALNPKAVLLAEIRYHDGQEGYLPDDSPWWMRDSKGNRVGTKNTAPGTWFYIDYSNSGFQDQAAGQCEAVVSSGVFDGCMFDWWSKEDSGRTQLIQKVRQAAGDSAILMVNVNQSQPVLSASYINGMYMEGMLPRSLGGLYDWQTAAANLLWAKDHLKSPAFTALDAWSTDPRIDPASLGKNDVQRMRFATTLSLTHSDGYVLFALPDGLPAQYYSGYTQSDHLHDWYPSFWDRSLGRPIESVGRQGPDGAFYRKFQYGEVVCNPPGGASVQVQFPSPRLSLATGLQAREFTVASGDGDMFLSL